MPPKKPTTKEMEAAKKQHNRKYGKKNYELEAHRALTNTVDGRCLHLSGQRAGGGLVLAESESEEELPPPLPRLPPKGVFGSILKEAKAGTKDTVPTSQTKNQRKIANGNRTLREPKSQPTRTEDVRVREASSQKARNGFLHTAISVCEKRHKFLVCHWSFSDPVNLKRTWRLEVVDFGQEFPNGSEDHEQCSSKLTELMAKLSKSMISDWDKVVRQRIIEEPDYDKRQLMKEKMDSEQLPSIVKIERKLGALAVYIMGSISGGGNAGGKDDKDRKDDKGKEDGESRNEAVEKKKKETRDAADLARLRKLMDDQGERRAADGARVKRNAENRAEAQRVANAADSVPDDVSRTRVRKANSKYTLRPEMIEEDEKALKSIRATERKEAKQRDQEQKDEEKLQQLAAQQLEADGAVELEEYPNEELGAAVRGALENASPELKSHKKQPTKNPPKKTKGVKSSTIKPGVNEPGVFSSLMKERKKKLKTCIRPVVEDSSDSDNVKPPQPSGPAKPKLKAKSTIRKPFVPFAEHLSAKKAAQGGESEAGEPSGKLKASAKSSTKETKIARIQEDKADKSDKFIADSDFEDDTAEDVKLPSDKLQDETASAEVTETISATLSAERDSNVVEKTIETTTAAVKIQHQHGSIERAEVTKSTTARSDSPEQNKTTVEHTNHVQTIAQLAVPEQELPRTSAPPSAAREPQDAFNTPTNAPGIAVPISTPQPAPPRSPPTPPRKRKHAESTEKPPPDPKLETKQQGSPASSAPSSPSPLKKRRLTPPALTHTRDEIARANPSTHSPKDATLSPESAPAPASANPPASPGERLVSPPSSSSSGKKRKIRSENDSEAPSSPGATKRVRVQVSGGAISERIIAAGIVEGECEGGRGEQGYAEILAGLDDIEDREESDRDSWDLLFDEGSDGE